MKTNLFIGLIVAAGLGLGGGLYWWNKKDVPSYSLIDITGFNENAFSSSSLINVPKLNTNLSFKQTIPMKKVAATKREVPVTNIDMNSNLPSPIAPLNTLNFKQSEKTKIEEKQNDPILLFLKSTGPFPYGLKLEFPTSSNGTHLCLEVEFCETLPSNITENSAYKSYLKEVGNYSSVVDLYSFNSTFFSSNLDLSNNKKKEKFLKKLWKYDSKKENNLDGFINNFNQLNSEEKTALKIFITDFSIQYKPIGVSDTSNSYLQFIEDKNIPLVNNSTIETLKKFDQLFVDYLTEENDLIINEKEFPAGSKKSLIDNKKQEVINCIKQCQYFIGEGALKSTILSALSDKAVEYLDSKQGSGMLCMFSEAIMNGFKAGYSANLIQNGKRKAVLCGNDFFFKIPSTPLSATTTGNPTGEGNKLMLTTVYSPFESKVGRNGEKDAIYSLNGDYFKAMEQAELDVSYGVKEGFGSITIKATKAKIISGPENSTVEKGEGVFSVSKKQQKKADKMIRIKANK